jgi:hypothetical protein
MDSRRSDVWQLVIVMLSVAALILLVAFARGDKHHRGDETGAIEVAAVAAVRSDGVSA